MKRARTLSIAGILHGALLLSSTALSSQDRDARVTPPGVVRASVAGVFSTFSSRFGSPLDAAATGRQPLAAPFEATLGPTTLAPLQRLQNQLDSIVDRTEAAPFGPGERLLALETGELHATADHRRVPFGFELGLLPRISVAVELPLTQQWLEVTHLGIRAGTVGLNPDPEHNRTVLASIDTVLRGIGGSRLLPTEASPVGQALQERVRAAAGGQELRLPREPIDRVARGGLASLETLGTGRYTPGRPAWGVGDATVVARVQLVNTLGSQAVGPEQGAAVRAAVEVGARLPTGDLAGAGYYVLPPPDEGLGGLVTGAYADLFASPRIGASVAARLETFRPVTLLRRSWTPADDFPPQPLDGSLTWTPGRLLTIDLAPQLRLVDEISLVGRVSLLRRSGEAYEFDDGTLAESVARSASLWGIGLAYSTLAAYDAGRTPVPFEATIGLRHTFAGSSGAPAERSVTMQGRLFLRLWGRR